MKTNIVTKAFLFSLSIAFASACGPAQSNPNGNPQQPGTAYLTIVGDQNVFLNDGVQQVLQVRYHDGSDQPLAGQVMFAVQGTAGGASLSAGSAVTDSNGVAQIQLVTGMSGQASFKVQASAAEAQPVEWSVAVTPARPPLDVTGTYAMHNQFNIISGLPGTVGDVVNGFTDISTNPGGWLLDQIQAKASSQISSAIGALRPALDDIITNAIKKNAPSFVNDIFNVGDAFGQIAHKFGIESTLTITGSNGGVDSTGLLGTHVVTGVKFAYNSQTFQYSMADMGVQDITVQNVGINLNGETDLAIGEHKIPLSYGSMLLIGLNQAIIPAIDPNASDLAGLLSDKIDCAAIGAKLQSAVGLSFIPASAYEDACKLGLQAGSNLLIKKIQSLDTAGIVLDISGTANPQDTDGDANHTADVLQNGKWQGALTYPGTQAALPADQNTFTGTRVTSVN